MAAGKASDCPVCREHLYFEEGAAVQASVGGGGGGGGGGGEAEAEAAVEPGEQSGLVNGQ
jgi:hypothetical protein